MYLAHRVTSLLTWPLALYHLLGAMQTDERLMM